MSYDAKLRAAVKSPHAQFHLFILTFSKGKPDEQYFFFEGHEDPAFYVDKAQVYLGDCGYHEFVCMGRDCVLKVHELVARDNRAIDRAHFFVDKDHNDITIGETGFSGSIFRTSVYSFENYLVCERVLRRFWVERLHLASTDERLNENILVFREMHASLMRRMRVLMAIVLIGRGINGNPAVKLNLNNVNLDKVIKLDFSKKRVVWQKNAMRSFLASSNMADSGVVSINVRDIKAVCRKHLLNPDSKSYVRGKYELWFFVKFLMEVTRVLADKKRAATLKVQRATPKEPLSHSNSIIQLVSLAPCPADLSKFLGERLPKPKV